MDGPTPADVSALSSRPRGGLDWFLPLDHEQLPKAELRRLRMGVATWLLGAGVALIVVVSRWLVAGFSAPLLTPFGSVVLAGPVLLLTRRLGITSLPGVALCVWTSIGVAIMATLGMPEVARYCVLLPLIAALLIGLRSVLVFTALALATLLLFRGPFSAGLTGAELWERVDLLTNTVMVGVLSYLSERFRSRAEQERDEARHEVLQLAREQAARREAARARARLLRLQAMQVDIGSALSSTGPLQGSLQRCCEAAVRHLDVAFARIWVLNDADDTLVLQASAGRYTHLGGTHSRIKVGQLKIGAIARERLPYQTNDVPNDPRIGDPAWARREGMVAFAGHPLLLGERLIGVLAMFSTQPLPEETLATLGTVADTLAQGIERKRAEEALALRAEELARSNEELARSNADLARSNADLQQFAYVASHDLQEPLRMVASYTQLLARRYKGRLDPDADDFIGYVVDGATRMKRLIQDLLEFSRVGTRGREPRPVNATEVLARTLKDLAANPLSGGAEVSHDPLPVIQADDLQLGQVFQNLLGNAFKFRRPGVPPRIHVSARQEGGQWVFSVRDNGIGIEAQYFDRIFVLFQRLHTSAEYPGTGIGLAVCKKIVERHGGRIHVESAPGEGSTFFFTLPAAAPEACDSAASVG